MDYVKHIVRAGLLAAALGAPNPAISYQRGHPVYTDDTDEPTQASAAGIKSKAIVPTLAGRLEILDGLYEKINGQFKLKGNLEREPYSPLWNYSARTEIDEKTGDRTVTLEQYSKLRANELSGLWQIADIDITAAFLDVANLPQFSEGKPTRDRIVRVLTTAYAKMNGLYDFENNRIAEEKARKLQPNQKIATQYGDVSSYKAAGLTDDERAVVEYVQFANSALNSVQPFWSQYPQLRQDFIESSDELARIREQLENARGDKAKISGLEKELSAIGSWADLLNVDLLEMQHKFSQRVAQYESRIEQMQQEHQQETQGLRDSTQRSADEKENEYGKRSIEQKEDYEARLERQREIFDRELEEAYDENRRQREIFDRKLEEAYDENRGLEGLLSNTKNALSAANTTLEELRKQIAGYQSELARYNLIKEIKGRVEPRIGFVYNPDNGKAGVISSIVVPLFADIVEGGDGDLYIKRLLGIEAGGTYGTEKETVEPFRITDLGDGFTARTGAESIRDGDIFLGVRGEHYLGEVGIAGGMGINAPVNQRTEGIEDIFYNGQPVGQGHKEIGKSRPELYANLGLIFRINNRTSAEVGFNSRGQIRATIGRRF